MRFLHLAGAALGVCAVLSRASDATACGGCFHSPTPTTDKPVVTDHRMVFSISTTQSILWDQIRYSGNPTDFAWVLPVKQGAKVEASNEGWFAALDAATQPVVVSPPTSGNASTAGGCSGLLACGSGGGASGSSTGGPGGVQVVSEGTAGIYDTVTLRSSDPNALVNWLDSNSYEIPDSIRPTIDAYVNGGFDFIALRIRPDCAVRAMQPVRVITPGADPTLPLRMVAAGVGANVGITLFVLSEGRYHPQNFPDAVVDYTGLTYDSSTASSNYEALVTSAMSGSAWVTEAAFNVNQGPPSPSLTATNPTLFTACMGGASGGGPPPPCDNAQSVVIDGGFDANGPDAGGDAANDAATADDAGDDAAADAAREANDDAGADTGTSGGADAEADSGSGSFGTPVCGDDLQLSMTGLHPADVWVTRLRAFLPADALAANDLVLEAAASQTPVSNVHQATSFSDVQPSACESTPRLGESAGGWAIIVVAGLGVAALTRRRRER